MMFERRLKIFLGLLLLVTVVLLLRALQVQVLQRDHWREQATESMKREELIETTRGKLLDHKGREIALDQACIDAAVDYRAITFPPDERWMREQAVRRLRQRRGEEYRAADTAGRRKLVDHEVALVQTEIQIMWETLAKLGGQPVEEIDETRRAIVRRVEMRRRSVWYRKFEVAKAAHENREPSPWWKQWLIDETQKAPQLDDFQIDVAEQTEPHVILRNIKPSVHNLLWKNLEKYPGLVLRPSRTRVYPFGEAACHVLGRLAKVSREDLKNDPHVGDSLRQYYPNDLIGRTGLEALCEPLLRGVRGREERWINDKAVRRQDPIDGQNVRTSIDIELQTEIIELFRQARVINPDNSYDTVAMHGGAVVLHVPSSQVLAIASYPGFDPNRLVDEYPRLVTDEFGKPLMNRATQFALEPGSTVKPIVGLGAITDRIVGAVEGIECTGYLTLGGKKFNVGRCWTASKFAAQYPGAVAHHQMPWSDPHRGHDGNADGFLSFSDALQRSCNVYFETLADRLGAEGLSRWFDRFGLGRPSGLGLPEASGRLPNEFRGPAFLRRSTTWFSGIGQGEVSATPIQMANVAATIARNGIWMRPKLVMDELPRSGDWGKVPDRVDLKLSPAALAAARQGMVAVVNTDAGTGKEAYRPDMVVAGKTGTAQAAKFTVLERGPDGKPLLDEKGLPVRRVLEPSTHAHPNPEAPWYRGFGEDGKDLNHAWFIGFAPANNPQVAVAVMVEYGGSGGKTAASVARDVLEACMVHGYLARDRKPEPKTTISQARAE